MWQGLYVVIEYYEKYRQTTSTTFLAYHAD